MTPVPSSTKLTFTPIQPGGPTGNTLEFPAYITSIGDSYSPSWSDHQDMGRGDPLVMYGSYSRSIDLQFMVVSLTKEENEQKKYLKDLSALSEMTRPFYKSGIGFNGMFCHMKLGNIFDEIGYINSLSYSIDNESPWISDAPIYISVSLNLKVIGDKRPEVNNGHHDVVVDPGKPFDFEPPSATQEGQPPKASASELPEFV